MCGILILLFTVVPIIEFLLLIHVGKLIGTTATLGLIIFTGILGATLARLEGWKTLVEMQRQLDRGQVPGRKLLDGLLILLGAVLLITPGIATDILGLSMILPGSRSIFRELLIHFLKNKIRYSPNLGVVKIDSEDIIDVTPRSDDNDSETDSNRKT